ncbi:hypothetical protein [Marinomonas algarum]|uniref:Uncharacterized protein n=1 Tax=Marinomonas algarum TaxID=2883105 RepID=A0A9X1LFF8_9GAMM|nr:hypothetical protein [Marinomonas algarum]MCB5162956.1 hypothetical protein [Marinomonas algarum]
MGFALDNLIIWSIVMNLFLFVVFLAALVGLMGFSVWMFVQAFKLSMQALALIVKKVFFCPIIFLLKAFAFVLKVVGRTCVLSFRLIRKSITHISKKIALFVRLFVRSVQNSFKRIKLQRKETSTRPEEVVIQSGNEKEEDLPSAFSSHLDDIDWSVYDTPTFVRKGILFW